jgi:hypothetical protein
VQETQEERQRLLAASSGESGSGSVDQEHAEAARRAAEATVLVVAQDVWLCPLLPCSTVPR